MIDLSNPALKTFIQTSNLIKKDLKPIVFWDTCSLIDIIRLPLPSRNNSANLNDRIVAIKNAIVGGKVYSLTSELCIQELKDNTPEYFDNYLKELTKLNNQVNNYVSFINKSGLVAPAIPKINLDGYKLERYFRDITQAIIDKTIFIQKSPIFLKNAGNRAITGITPAKNKKGEIKDCYIWETCLQTRARISNKALPWIFISSNIDDYTNRIDTISFAPDIQTEVTANNILYAKDFHILHHLLSPGGFFIK